MTKKKIVCIHLFNNYSGSPKVLMQAIESLKTNGYEIDLICNRSEGFLSNIPGIQYRFISYNWSKNKILTLFNFIFAQIQLFAIVIRNYRKNDSILYLNTITPFGAAIAGKIYHKKIIYHVHEKYTNINIINKICQYFYENSNCYSIFVSKYLQESYPTKIKNSTVIYNSLEKKFLDASKKYVEKRIIQPGTILMVCSLRGFKGIYEFVELSKLMTMYKFELVLSASKNEVDHFKQDNIINSNMIVFENQTDLQPFYQRAKLLLNLSDPNQWIETFGLTILEAMAYGIPSLVPNIGGPIELIADGVNGYLIHPKDLKEVKQKIENLMNDAEMYAGFSRNALLKSKDFENDKMASHIVSIIEKIQDN